MCQGIVGSCLICMIVFSRGLITLQQLVVICYIHTNSLQLIIFVLQGSLATCEFLLLNSADVTIADDNGQPALHHATLQGHTAQVCQLLKRGADYKHKDDSQSDALDLAMKAELADIVTLYVNHRPRPYLIDMFFEDMV